MSRAAKKVPKNEKIVKKDCMSIYVSTNEQGKYNGEIGGSGRGINTFENRNDCKVISLLIMIYF